MRLGTYNTGLSPQLFTTGRSKVVLLLEFKFFQVFQIMSFMLHDISATRISFSCSLGPLHFTCSVQGTCSTVTSLIQQLVILLSVINVTLWYICMVFSLDNFTYLLQKLRATTGTCKTGLSPPVILYYWSFQGDTSVVVLNFLCLGIEFLCCLHLMFVFIF